MAVALLQPTRIGFAWPKLVGFRRSRLQTVTEVRDGRSRGRALTRTHTHTHAHGHTRARTHTNTHTFTRTLCWRRVPRRGVCRSWLPRRAARAVRQRSRRLPQAETLPAALDAALRAPGPVGAAMVKAFEATDAAFIEAITPAFKLGFDVNHVGACLISALVDKDVITVANGPCAAAVLRRCTLLLVTACAAGDCRAVIGRVSPAEGGRIRAVELSRDHNARMPEVRSCGGHARSCYIVARRSRRGCDGSTPAKMT